MATPGSPPTPRRTSKVAATTPTGDAETGVRASEAGEAGASPTVSGPAIDQVLVELERVVAELEAGDLPLETALKRFEDGVRLARQGGQLLDAVEQRVEMLLEGREGTAPFPGARDGDDDDDGEDDDDSV